MQYLTLPQVLLIAEEVTGIPSHTLQRISRMDLLESAVNAPQIELKGLDPYPEIWEKGAVLTLRIALHHPLLDGNKRLAFLAAYEFFWINGFDLIFEVDDAEAIFFRIAAGQVSHRELSDWYRKRLIHLEN